MFLLLGCVVFQWGCRSPIGADHISREEWFEEHTQTALNTNQLSFDTKNFLGRKDLLDKFYEHPEGVIIKLCQQLMDSEEWDREQLSALVELSYICGKKVRDPEKSIKYFLACGAFSYAYLFSNKVKQHPPTPYEPRFVFICRYYNYSLAEILSYFQENKLPFEKDTSLPFIKGGVEFLPAKSDFPLGRYKEFLSCFDYSPRGLLVQSRRSGLGMPVIGIRKDKFFRIKKGMHISEESFMITLFIKFSISPKGALQARMEFYDTLKTDQIEVAGKQVPLEIDISTPLGKMLEYGDFTNSLKYMFNPDAMGVKQGLYIMTPYQKDKIPVVLVHGLMSKPRTWTQMVNILLNNKKIRKNYQFWLFAYPTGSPFVYSACLLRRALTMAQEKYNPDGTNPKFNDMVLVAHSMGGLLSKMMIQNGGEKLSKAYFNKPIEQLDITTEEKDFIKELILFKELPFIKRVIFISVPHRGAEMATWSITTWASSMIKLPHKLVQDMNNIMSLKAFKIKRNGNGTEKDFNVTGLDTLRPDNKALKLLMEIPLSNNVKCHTVCGNDEAPGIPYGTDGIVPYTSSHLECVKSEKIVKSGHSVHHTPLGIKEVERILLEHLKEFETENKANAKPASQK